MKTLDAEIKKINKKFKLKLKEEREIRKQFDKKFSRCKKNFDDLD